MTDAWRADAAAWWASAEWQAYEVANRELAGARTTLLASADWTTRVLDLTPGLAAIKRGMTKGRRHDIRRGLAGVTPITAMPDAFNAYHALRLEHQPHARPAETYLWQRMWCENGRAVVVALPDVAVLCILHGRWSYYASKAGPRTGTTAAALWTAIGLVAERGVETVELGWQGHATDAKGQNVEAFIRHFGGVDVPARLP